MGPIIPILINIANSPHPPPRIRSAALYAIGDVIRSNTTHQTTFSAAISTSPVSTSTSTSTSSSSQTISNVQPVSSSSSSSPSRLNANLTNGDQQHHHSKQQPFILTVLEMCVGAGDPTVRAASVYAVQCYLSGNDDAKLAVASTLISTPGELPNVESSGRCNSKIYIFFFF